MNVEWFNNNTYINIFQNKSDRFVYLAA